jgi:DNA-binding NarL/FixJ family response regulator
MATTSQTFIRREIAPVSAGTPFIRTLVVDDMAGMAETMSSILGAHRWIHVVGRANNGLAAIKVALVEVPDLIVMDLHMPVMNGLKATMHIKQRLPETRVILVSSDDDAEIALAAMDCGADGFIPKAKFAGKCDWHIRRLFGEGVHALRLCGHEQNGRHTNGAMTVVQRQRSLA